MPWMAVATGGPTLPSPTCRMRGRRDMVVRSHHVDDLPDGFDHHARLVELDVVSGAGNDLVYTARGQRRDVIVQFHPQVILGVAHRLGFMRLARKWRAAQHNQRHVAVAAFATRTSSELTVNTLAHSDHAACMYSAVEWLAKNA